MKKKPQIIHSSLAEILRSSSLKLDDKEAINSLIRKGLDDIGNNDQRQHGHRIESMFAYMAGALGNCNLVKQEDASGLCLVADDKITVPDYRITTKDGVTFLVEVKNCRKRKISFKQTYIKSLKKYAELSNWDLKIAIYWSNLKIWTMISPSWFNYQKDKYCVHLDKALAMNEMALLNDRMIATKPPLRLKLIMDEEKTSEIDKNGKCLFTIRDVEIFCGYALIEDILEKNIAFQLILAGKWKEEENILIQNNKINYIEYEYTPVEVIENQPFASLGFLSSIVSTKYDSLTVHNGQIERLAPECEPEQLQIFIPQDYKGKNLLLWQFLMQPNPKYTAINERTK